MAEHVKLGSNGEKAAANFLSSKGYKIIETNWRHHHLEIDIVAENDDFIIFAEVKTRRSVLHANPEDSVNWRKMKYLLNAAEAYIGINRVDKNPRFDIISVACIGNKFHISHIEDAFISPVY